MRLRCCFLVCLLLPSNKQHDPLYTLLPSMARLVFASVLLMFFIKSGITKFDGLFTPSTGSFVQIFPSMFEKLGYDSSKMPFYTYLIALLGGWAEILLPILLLLGLFTRLAALGMVGFTVVMSLVDIYGHNVGVATAGMPFDGQSNGLIADQRLLWFLLFSILILMGAGKLSIDYLLLRWLKSSNKLGD